MSETVHGTALVVGARGILVRGASGAGKSGLAALLIRRGARLVADDRVHLSPCNGRLVAAAPAALAGRMEMRGRGIVAMPSERSAVIRLVVDIVAEADMERMPDLQELSATLLGITVPRQPAPGASGHAVLLVEAALDALAAAPNMRLRSGRVWG